MDKAEPLIAEYDLQEWMNPNAMGSHDIEKRCHPAFKSGWKLEDNVYDLITLTEQVLSDDPLFFAINSYTEGLSPAVMEYIVKTTLCPVKGGHTHCDEIGLPVSATGGVVPCGATAIWEK